MTKGASSRDSVLVVDPKEFSDRIHGKKPQRKKAGKKSTGVVPKCGETEPAKLDGEKLLAEVREIQRNATGVKGSNFAQRLVTNAASLLLSETEKKEGDRVELLLGILEGIEEFEPKNGIQAMLSVQMLGVHEVALKFLRNATREGQTYGNANMHVNWAARFMKLFVEQTEAMAKLKGTAGQQKVTVEHVTVNSGGQAVVGNVETGGRGASESNET